jgi:hypothetical protein
MGLNLSNVADDRRRAGASMANGHDHQAVDRFDFLPQIRVIGCIRAFLGPEDGFDFRHVDTHPRLHLLQKLVAAIESFIHKVHGFAFQACGARRHRSIGGGLPVGFKTVYKGCSAAAKVPAQTIATLKKASLPTVWGTFGEHLVGHMAIPPAPEFYSAPTSDATARNGH